MGCQFLFIDPQNYLHIMRTFPNYIENEPLNLIKASLENCGNERSSYRIFFQNSLVFSLNGNVCLELTESAVGRVVLLQLIFIYTMEWSVLRTWVSCSYGALHGDCRWLWKTVEIPIGNDGEPLLHCMWRVPHSTFGSTNHIASIEY